MADIYKVEMGDKFECPVDGLQSEEGQVSPHGRASEFLTRIQYNPLHSGFKSGGADQQPQLQDGEIFQEGQALYSQQAPKTSVHQPQFTNIPQTDKVSGSLPHSNSPSPFKGRTTYNKETFAIPNGSESQNSISFSSYSEKEGRHYGSSNKQERFESKNQRQMSSSNRDKNDGRQKRQSRDNTREKGDQYGRDNNRRRYEDEFRERSRQKNPRHREQLRNRERPQRSRIQNYNQLEQAQYAHPQGQGQYPMPYMLPMMMHPPWVYYENPRVQSIEFLKESILKTLSDIRLTTQHEILVTLSALIKEEASSLKSLQYYLAANRLKSMLEGQHREVLVKIIRMLQLRQLQFVENEKKVSEVKRMLSFITKDPRKLIR